VSADLESYRRALSAASCEHQPDCHRPRNDQVDIHALILVPVFFAMTKHRARRQGSLGAKTWKLVFDSGCAEIPGEF
jgi:hypothetical protein